MQIYRVGAGLPRGGATVRPNKNPRCQGLRPMAHAGGTATGRHRQFLPPDILAVAGCQPPKRKFRVPPWWDPGLPRGTSKSDGLRHTLAGRLSCCPAEVGLAFFNECLRTLTHVITANGLDQGLEARLHIVLRGVPPEI